MNRRRWLFGWAGLALLAALGLWAGRVAPALLLARDVWSLDRIEPVQRGVVVEEREIGLGVPADLYLPGSGARPGGALLLVHGLLDEGKRDPRLRGLATAIAARGVAVLVPEFPDMKVLKVRREEVGGVARAFRALRSLPGVRRCGLAAFSFGAGPAVLALGEPGVAEQLDLLILFGGYHDLQGVVTYQTTGSAGGPEVPPPDPRARWYFLGANADLVQGARDRELLAEMARRRQAMPAADVSAMAAALGPEGRRFYALLENRDPARAAERIADLGPAAVSLLAALSPSRLALPDLSAEVFLIHARSDVLIPYTQTLALARQLRTRGRLHVVLLGAFTHVGPAERASGWIRNVRQAGADWLALWSTCRATLSLQD